MFLALILTIAGVAVATLASSPTAIVKQRQFDSGIPTDTPIPGNYSGPWRPQGHFSPPKNFMNDLNGLHVDSNGTWHLYYQCKSLAFPT
jgi:beta-fructofuranosidase